MKGTPEAIAACHKEWPRLSSAPARDMSVVRDWGGVCAIARKSPQAAHLGRVFGVFAETGAQLPKGPTSRVPKYSVVFHGNDVKDQNYEYALFQDLGGQSGEHASWQGC